MTTTTTEKCPRCRRSERLLGLSRKDNKTMICPDCATLEAMYQRLWPDRELPPVNECLLCGGKGDGDA